MMHFCPINLYCPTAPKPSKPSCLEPSKLCRRRPQIDRRDNPTGSSGKPQEAMGSGGMQLYGDDFEWNDSTRTGSRSHGKPREAMGCHGRQGGSHRKQPEATRNGQKQPETTIDNQEEPKTTNNKQKHPGTISNNQKQPETFRSI